VKLPWRRGETPEDGIVHEPLVLPEPPNPRFYDPAWDEWDVKKGPSRRTVIIIVVVGILAVGGFFAYKESQSSKAPVVAFSPPTTFSVASTPSTPSPSVFTGKVSTTTSQFTLSGRPAILGASCSCTGPKFEVQVLDSTGNVIATPIQTTGLYGGGNFAGSAPLTLPAGNYTLQVSAIGRWKVTVTTPPTDQPTLPLKSLSFGGSGSSVIGPFAANHSFYVVWSLPQAPAPIQLQMIDSVTGTATTLHESTSTIKPLFLRINAQQDPFYLFQGPTSYLWGLIIKPAS
jgi:hypothetical protein